MNPRKYTLRRPQHSSPSSSQGSSQDSAKRNLVDLRKMLAVAKASAGRGKGAGNTETEIRVNIVTGVIVTGPNVANNKDIIHFTTIKGKLPNKSYEIKDGIVTGKKLPKSLVLSVKLQDETERSFARVKVTGWHIFKEGQQLKLVFEYQGGSGRRNSLYAFDQKRLMSVLGASTQVPTDKPERVKFSDIDNTSTTWVNEKAEIVAKAQGSTEPKRKRGVRKPIATPPAQDGGGSGDSGNSPELKVGETVIILRKHNNEDKFSIKKILKKDKEGADSNSIKIVQTSGTYTLTAEKGNKKIPRIIGFSKLPAKAGKPILYPYTKDALKTFLDESRWHDLLGLDTGTAPAASPKVKDAVADADEHSDKEIDDIISDFLPPDEDDEFNDVIVMERKKRSRRALKEIIRSFKKSNKMFDLKGKPPIMLSIPADKSKVFKFWLERGVLNADMFQPEEDRWDDFLSDFHVNSRLESANGKKALNFLGINLKDYAHIKKMRNTSPNIVGNRPVPQVRGDEGFDDADDVTDFGTGGSSPRGASGGSLRKPTATPPAAPSVTPSNPLNRQSDDPLGKKMVRVEDIIQDLQDNIKDKYHDNGAKLLAEADDLMEELNIELADDGDFKLVQKDLEEVRKSFHASVVMTDVEHINSLLDTYESQTGPAAEKTKKEIEAKLASMNQYILDNNVDPKYLSVELDSFNQEAQKILGAPKGQTGGQTTTVTNQPQNDGWDNDDTDVTPPAPAPAPSQTSAKQNILKHLNDHIASMKVDSDRNAYTAKETLISVGSIIRSENLDNDPDILNAKEELSGLLLDVNNDFIELNNGISNVSRLISSNDFVEANQAITGLTDKLDYLSKLPEFSGSPKLSEVKANLLAVTTRLEDVVKNILTSEDTSGADSMDNPVVAEINGLIEQFQGIYKAYENYISEGNRRQASRLALDALDSYEEAVKMIRDNGYENSELENGIVDTIENLDAAMKIMEGD